MLKIFILINTLYSFIHQSNIKSNMASYNAVIKYNISDEINFPDFTVIFMGTTSNSIPNNTNFKMLKHHFKIKKGDIDESIFWSSGTGRISPKKFKFNGIDYTIELAWWLNKKIQLHENEMVITKQISKKTEAYQSIVKYGLNDEINFPDFTITYTGTTAVSIPNNTKVKTTFYHFNIKSKTATQSIKWSSGTGEISPLKFDIDGKFFALELLWCSAKKKNLNDGELVMSTI